MKIAHPLIAAFVLILSVWFAVYDSSAQIGAPTDIENLSNASSIFVRAYERIRIIDAWNFLRNLGLNFNTTTIGVIDTGVDGSNGRHQEFRGINFGSSGRLSLQDRAEELKGSRLAAGHGTQVAGIIGGNNISATSSNNYKFPQMNGVVSGATDKYILESRASTLVTVATLGGILSTLPRETIVNMSFGGANCSELPILVRRQCFKSNEFSSTTAYFIEGINARPDILFLISAGNNRIDSQFATPANIKRDNTIIVAASDFADARASFSNFGAGIDIAAPGVEVYAPAIRGKGNFPTNTISSKDYDQFFSGTSASAPLVTGVAAILKSIKPSLTPAQIKDILTRSADPLFTPIGSDEAKKSLGSDCSGVPPSGQVQRGCRLNALRAVQTALKNQILIYFGNGGANPEQFGSGAAAFTTLQNRYQSAGSLVSYTDIFPPDLNDFRLAFIVLPGADNDSEINFFTPSQVNTLNAFLEKGGRLVTLGNHSGLFGINTLNNLLSRLNLDIKQNADAVTRDFDAGLPLTDITLVPVTAGVHSLDFSAASSLTIGPKAISIVRIQSGLPNAGASVVALQKTGNGEVIVIGDSQGFDDFAFSDPAGDGFGDAFQFADNLAVMP